MFAHLIKRSLDLQAVQLLRKHLLARVNYRRDQYIGIRGTDGTP